MSKKEFQATVTISLSEYEKLKKLEIDLIQKTGNYKLGWYNDKFWFVSLSEQKAISDLSDMNAGLQNKIRNQETLINHLKDELHDLKNTNPTPKRKFW